MMFEHQAPRLACHVMGDGFVMGTLCRKRLMFGLLFAAHQKGVFHRDFFNRAGKVESDRAAGIWCPSAALSISMMGDGLERER
jgi:hypothetical protein